ncbi:ATP-binding protein [Streptomyces sp. ISL-10]|uniref:ATP-binding protein n=1 Tax=Streptomyces sp. ISL-10 TaxID=2819172 RepID=UPI002034B4B5|nr:ATP-binding protein [Streptomyces sp. ISL-10]
MPVAVPMSSLVAAAAVGGAVGAAAPEAAGPYVVTTVAVAWVCLAIAVVGATVALHRQQDATASARRELRILQNRFAQSAAESAHLVDVTMPSVVRRLRDGASTDDALTSTPRPDDPRLRRVLKIFVTEICGAEHRVRSAAANAARAVRQLTLAADAIDRLTTVTLPTAVARLRGGASAETVLGELELPADARLRALTDTAVRELATSERRAAAAQAAGAEALSRVQAQTVSILADLREMQERHGEEVLGDLLGLDHKTSRLGFMTDRLTLLTGGRASRSWNRPIPVESILRGAVGRIAAYRRVRMHPAGTAAIAGFAAEGVMHLLAELMDNAANFSPPVDEVHVYVEERTAGLVVTIEDSGPKMGPAAMRRAEEAASGHVTDLAALQGTRLGLAVVGRLAVTYGMNVSFRPSSLGGTGVVVLVPPHLLARPADSDTEEAGHPAAAPQEPTSSACGTVSGAPQDRGFVPAQDSRRTATAGGLPVRPPGRTMAANRGAADLRPGEEAVARFDAFHRTGRPTREMSDTPAADPEPGTTGRPDAPDDPAQPGTTRGPDAPNSAQPGPTGCPDTPAAEAAVGHRGLHAPTAGSGGNGEPAEPRLPAPGSSLS